MTLIFDDIIVADRDDNEHKMRVRVDEYIPYAPATQWEPEQPESCEWVFCDEKGRFIMPDFEISEREDERITDLIIRKIRDDRDHWGEP